MVDQDNQPTFPLDIREEADIPTCDKTWSRFYLTYGSIKVHVGGSWGQLQHFVQNQRPDSLIQVFSIFVLFRLFKIMQQD